MLYQYSSDDIRHGKPPFPVHIDNKKPRIKPKRQPGIGSASWQYASLWVVICNRTETPEAVSCRDPWKNHTRSVEDLSLPGHTPITGLS